MSAAREHVEDASVDYISMLVMLLLSCSERRFCCCYCDLSISKCKIVLWSGAPVDSERACTQCFVATLIP